MKHLPITICLLILLSAILPSTAQKTITWQTSIPTVSSFSSPRAIDLNQDGVKDIVLGAGIEGEPSPAGIFAFDGKDGSILWQRYARDQMYGSPIFQDITNDNIPEVFISGRDAQIYALNGKTGFVIWEFWPGNKGSALDSGWYNFYLPQWISDQDNDGYQDLIVTNGGDPTIAPPDKDRPAGYLMVLSGIDGSIIQIDTMPDGQETYHSPLVIDFLQTGKPSILFGSGGETVGGSYWEIRLDHFISTGLIQSQSLLTDSIEGYIAVPSVADLNANGIPDLIIPQLNGNIIALEGGSKQELWRHTEPNWDCYVSPAMGQFTGDPTPDVFIVAANGNWPFYQETKKLLIDGSNGQAVWSELGYRYQMTNGIAIDWDNDGFDEIIYPRNDDIGDTARYLVHQFFLYDFNDHTIDSFDIQRDGLINFSTPLITDLDDDQSLEMIFVTHDNTSDWYQPNGFTIHRMDLGLSRQNIAWGGYLGTNGDGVYPQDLQVSVEFPLESNLIKAYPNPVRQTLYFESPTSQPITQITIFDAIGKEVLNSDFVNEVFVGELSSGIYFYRVRVGEEIIGGRIMKY